MRCSYISQLSGVCIRAGTEMKEPSRNRAAAYFRPTAAVIAAALCILCAHRSSASPGTAHSIRSEIITYAQKYIGTRYRRGGISPSGFDCSGFVMYVYSRYGFHLPRTSGAQYRSGRRISLRKALPGDLIFFATRGRRISHSGIYIGHRKFIHAPSTGKFVRIDSVDSRYWRKRFRGVIRISGIDKVQKKVIMAKITEKSSAKKAAPKKTAKKTVKKTSPAKAAPSPALQSRIMKLDSILPELASDEIDFLIEQAGVFIHNRDVTRMMQEQQRIADSQKPEDRKKKLEELDKSNIENVSVEEGSEGNHFILVMRNYRNFFARDEMKKVVRVCQSAAGSADGAKRLYRWFEKFRGDVISNSGLSSHSDPVLAKMYTIIVSTYTTSD